MISIDHGVNVMHYFPQLIRADQSRKTKFINSTKRLEVLFAFADCSYQASG